VRGDEGRHDREAAAEERHAQEPDLLLPPLRRYIEGCAGTKDAMIEKLRLKNATLKNQITKMEQQLQQKEEMGEVYSLHLTNRTPFGENIPCI
jgi:hypothetical protein